MALMEWELVVRLQLRIFLQGLRDSLAFHRTLPDLVNNPTAASVMGKILAANGGLIVGSIVLFHRGIVPFLDVLGQNAFDLNNQFHYDSLLWFVYRWLWLGPICILCYICCLTWYSELGESLKKKVPERPRSTDSLNQGLATVYALIVWVVAFAQLQILNHAVPAVFRGLEFFAEKIFATDPAIHSKVVVQFLTLTKAVCMNLIRATQLCNSLVAGLLMTTLYAWYCFDPIWIAQGVHPDERFSRIHKHLAYFLGFGIPYTILLKNTSFFVGFSVFLMLFPLSVILGSVSDYAQPYRDYEVKPVSLVQVFQPAQQWTLYVLKPFNKKKGVTVSMNEGHATVTKSRQEVKVPRAKSVKEA